MQRLPLTGAEKPYMERECGRRLSFAKRRILCATRGVIQVLERMRRCKAYSFEAYNRMCDVERSEFEFEMDGAVAGGDPVRARTHRRTTHFTRT